ncbi:MAG TPA: TAXI family TRAP transporter solute-binding subunit [Desulfobacteraceae bacterium]|nr:TAXI family TRAP transporter solute-binding subunit [Desulfobacteraceae bacterium]HPJ66497.1 TAXI family TRAP transporter solute-binding subunit [Desulfobacteraceae bacterium]HPQ28215.1 TAXI family TRAP transporter solute-binding subunit [Desulfobacteraceae bacterium]
MKRALYVLLIISVAATLIITCQATAEKKIMLKLGSGSPGGVYYPLGDGMEVLIEQTVEDIACTAKSTGGSVENCHLVGFREIDLGMVMGSVAYKATKGLAPFKKKYDLVCLFQMYPAPEHIVTTRQTGIKSIADLKGKKISIDVPGSGCSTQARAILSEYGYNLENDLTLVNLDQTESVQALKDGVVDACFFNFAYPASAVKDLAAATDIIMIPLEETFVDRLVEKHPYYLKIVIPSGTYDDVNYDVLCLGDSNLLIANRKMENDVAYKLTKAVFENVSTGEYALTNIHPVAAQLTKENALKSPIPLHSGAEKYFMEAK